MIIPRYKKPNLYN